MTIWDERYTPAGRNQCVDFLPSAVTGQSLVQLTGAPLPVGANGAWIQSTDAPWLWRLDGSSITGFTGQSIITPAFQIVRLSNREQLEAIRISGTTTVTVQFFIGGVPGTTE